MLYFENDYSKGAHEAVLQKLMDTKWRIYPDTGMTDIVNPQKKRSAPCSKPMRARSAEKPSSSPGRRPPTNSL